MNHKYCIKQGQHQNRLIEALCLDDKCSKDRLLCFYCKHQNHRDHETVYFPKGLTGSLQKLNANSRVENASKEQQKIDKKISSIKKGWQAIQQLMSQHLKLIQKQINLRFQTIQNTFSPDSIQRIKKSLSSQYLSEEEIQKYINMINNVDKFQLNCKDNVMIYTKIKERFLSDIYKKTQQQVLNIMNQLEYKAKNLDFGSFELQDYMKNFENSSDQSQSLLDPILQYSNVFSDQQSLDEFKRKFEDQFDRTQSEISYQVELQNHQENFMVLDQISKYYKDEQNLINNHQKNDENQIPMKNFHIKLGKSMFPLDNLNENNLQQLEDEQIINFVGKNRLKYLNIIKLTNDMPLHNQDLDLKNPNGVISFEEQSFETLTNRLQQKNLSKISQSRKKIKLNQDVRNKKGEFIQAKKSQYSDKIKNLFQKLGPSSGNMSRQSSDIEIKGDKIALKNDQTLYGDFDFSKPINLFKNNIKNETTKKIIDNPKNFSKEQFDLKQSIHEDYQYAQIQRKMIKLTPKQQLSKSHYYPFIKVVASNLTQVYQNLQLINNQIIIKLQIYSDSTFLCLDEQIIDLICKMKKLISLKIYMTFQLDKEQVKRMVKCLPLLQELVLCQYNRLDIETAKIIKNHLPNLRRFYYVSDYKNYMQKMEQNFEFFVDMNAPTTPLQVLQILSQIPKLQSIQLINIPSKNTPKVSKILKKMENIKQITITNTNNVQSNSTQIVQVIADSYKNLSVFCVHNSYFKEEHLIKIFKNNKNLQTVIINQSLQIQNSTMKILLTHCPNLEQLSLMLTDSINGKQIYSFLKLKTLILRGCWKIDKSSFLNNIHKLQKLQCLSVSLNNFWFYDHLMNEVVKLSNLKFLNLDTTKVTNSGIQNINKLSQLQTLICGRTEVTFQGLIKSLKNPQTGDKNYNIKKLGLSKDQSYTNQVNKKGQKNDHDINITSFHAKNLIALGKALPALTHLTIGGFIDPKKQYFETLKNLKCLGIRKKQLAKETENWLTEKGVWINEDY